MEHKISVDGEMPEWETTASSDGLTLFEYTEMTCPSCGGMVVVYHFPKG